MNSQRERMSPVTAFFLGVFGLGAVVIACGSTVTIFGMRVLETKASEVLGFAESTISDLPEIIERLPRALGDVLNDRRAPEYAGAITVDAEFLADEGHSRIRPVLTIKNEGDEVVSLLAVRIAALDDKNRPRCEWTEVVATPLAIDDEWRGPLMPGATRHVVVHSGWRCRQVSVEAPAECAVEISELRLWQPESDTGANLTAMHTP